MTKRRHKLTIRKAKKKTETIS